MQCLSHFFLANSIPQWSKVRFHRAVVLIDWPSQPASYSGDSSLWVTHPAGSLAVALAIQLIESQKQFDQPNEKCELCQECHSVSAIYWAIFEYRGLAGCWCSKATPFLVHLGYVERLPSDLYTGENNSLQSPVQLNCLVPHRLGLVVDLPSGR